MYNFLFYMEKDDNIDLGSLILISIFSSHVNGKKVKFTFVTRIH